MNSFKFILRFALIFQFSAENGEKSKMTPIIGYVTFWKTVFHAIAGANEAQTIGIQTDFF
jgi:hypothetical protein